jgi:hypothetical protein
MADRDNKCAVACAEQLRNQVIDVRLVFAYIAMLTRADVLDYADHQRPLFIVRKASNLLRNTVVKEPEIPLFKSTTASPRASITQPVR